MSNEIPRRARMDKMTPAELAICTAMQAVEEAGASVSLTDAVVLLGKARDKVADHVDGVPADPVVVDEDKITITRKRFMQLMRDAARTSIYRHDEYQRLSAFYLIEYHGSPSTYWNGTWFGEDVNRAARFPTRSGAEDAMVPLVAKVEAGDHKQQAANLIVTEHLWIAESDRVLRDLANVLRGIDGK